jgi:hypothetical protein
VVAEPGMSAKSARTKELVHGSKIVANFDENVIYTADVKIDPPQGLEFRALQIKHHEINVPEVMPQQSIRHCSGWGEEYLR